MNTISIAVGAALLVAGFAGVSLAANVNDIPGLTTSNAGSSTGLLVPPGIAATAPARDYQKAVGQQLFHRFGPGSHSRTLYCAGSVAIGFRILPDGRVRDARLLHPGDAAYNANLLAAIANMTFPRFRAGMTTQPLPEVYRYGVAPLAENFLKQRYNCR